MGYVANSATHASRPAPAGTVAVNVNVLNAQRQRPRACPGGHATSYVEYMYGTQILCKILCM
jgi:hypothetical protein